MPSDTARPEESNHLENINKDGDSTAKILDQFWDSRSANDGTGNNPFDKKSVMSSEDIAKKLEELQKLVCESLGFGSCDLFDSKETTEPGTNRQTDNPRSRELPRKSTSPTVRDHSTMMYKLDKGSSHLYKNY